jgi:pimeloyl-ACP methyl ester carboxylesterase
LPSTAITAVRPQRGTGNAAASFTTTMTAALKPVRTGTLEIAYEESGDSAGAPVVLLHGWPYDPRCFDQVVKPLIAGGCRVIVPYLRGFGATRFLSAETLRSGQQAGLGNDVREMMDALGIERAILAGYDWGGRAACIVAALWPQRVGGLVTVNAYNIQDIAGSARPQDPAQERRYWYQWYFQTERGRAGLELNRREFCRLLWELWSPDWKFDQASFARSALSFDNPDFVPVTIHSYRHRYGNAAGDPALEDIERRLAAKPKIAVPTIALQGETDGVLPPEVSERHGALFTGPYQYRVLPKVGHNPPQEAPGIFAQAVLQLVKSET